MFKTLALALVMLAAPSKPVITVDGVAAATHISQTTRAAIAANVKALNAKLEQVVAQTPSDDQLQAIHEQCMAIHDAIAAQLSPEEQHAFLVYLHAQMKAAGIDVDKFAGHHAHHE